MDIERICRPAMRAVSVTFDGRGLYICAWYSFNKKLAGSVAAGSSKINEFTRSAGVSACVGETPRRLKALFISRYDFVNGDSEAL